MAECLVVATKRGGGNSRAAYSNLTARPSSLPGSRRGSEGRKGPCRAGRHSRRGCSGCPIHERHRGGPWSGGRRICSPWGPRRAWPIVSHHPRHTRNPGATPPAPLGRGVRLPLSRGVRVRAWPIVSHHPRHTREATAESWDQTTIGSGSGASSGRRSAIEKRRIAPVTSV